MPSMILRKKIPLRDIFKKIDFICLEIEPMFEFVEGKRTEQIEGYRYTVVDTADFNRIKVKIRQPAPLMADDDLQQLRANGDTIFVVFENGYLMPYWSSKTQTIEDSFGAEGIHLVEKDDQII